MRRAGIILVLVMLMVGGGLGLLWLGPTPIVPLLGHAANRIAAGALFLCGAALGLWGMLNGHKALQRLTVAVRQTGGLQRLAASHPGLAPLADAVNRMIETAQQGIASAELRAKELGIRLKVATAERERMEAIIYSISDAVLVTDPFDDVVLANDSARRILNAECRPSSGQSRNSALSPPHSALSAFPPELAKLIRDMRQSDSRGGRRIAELKTPSPSGDRVYKVTLSCVDAATHARGVAGAAARAGPSVQHAPAGVVAVLHDMTREREVAQMKSDFVSNVSHELRTPLASIRAYAEMLIDGEAEDQKTAHEFYEVIQNEANRLGRLIDNILNISRIESGVVKIHKQPQSLMVILKEAIEVISPQAKQKRIVLEERISPAFYQTSIDRDMLYEACMNLLSNAVKYTPESGRITVQTLVDESRKTVAVRVSDTGVGIPPKDLPFIFDKFYRCEANSRMAKGTGLGLSLVKHIIETVHHGRLFVESRVGEGSTFGFELELAE